MGTILLMGAGLQTTVTGPTYDPDAQAFFNAETAAGVTLTSTQKDAVNQLVVDLKAASIWTKMKAVYPMIGGTATAHKFNLINPADTNAAFRLQFFGGWTHSANGALPNGVDAYANTFLSPSTQLNLTSTHLSYYSRTDVNLTQVEIGSQSVFAYTIIEARTANVSYFLINTNTIAGVTDTNSAAFYIANRTASNVNNGFRNNVKIFNSAYNADALPVGNIYIGALNNVAGAAQYYSSKQCAFATIGDGLTDLESQLFYQITEKYQVALGRNVNATQSFYYNSAYNNETNAFLFSTQITDNTIQTATNTLVNDLKTANIWTKMKAVYPMVGGTATTHKFNLVNAQDANAAYRLVFSGGVTHSSSGVLFNGTNGWADTFMNMSTNFTAYDIHLAANITTDFAGTLAQGHIGANTGSTSVNRLGAANSTNETSYLANSSGLYTVSKTVTSTTHKGFWCGSRLSATSHNLIDPTGTITSNTTATTGTQPNLTIGLGCRRGTTNDMYSAFEYSFFSAGVGLTTSEMASLKTAVNNFQTALGRI